MTQITTEARSSVPNGHGAKFSRVRERVIASLLVNGTVAGAAEESGINECTLRRWLATNPEFRQTYESRRKELLDCASNSLRAHCFAAVDVLGKLIADDEVTPSARIAAARCVLELAFRSGEAEELHDISERLTKLETALVGQQVWRSDVSGT